MLVDRFGRTLELVRTAWLLYSAQRPPRIVGTVIGPRLILQALYWTFLGRLVSGSAGARYAFVGATVVVMLATLVSDLSDIPVDDRADQTWFRVVLSPTATFKILLIRALPYLLEAIACALSSAIVVGLILGYWRIAADLVLAVPLYAVIGLSMMMAGTAVAVVSVAMSAEVIVGNLAMYLLLLTSGAVIPSSRVPVLDSLSELLPMRHGVSALRAFVSGGPVLKPLLLEGVVGVGWGFAGAALLAWLLRRDRRMTGVLDRNG
jgi:ABC-type multidrug transport system permease subunit